MYISHRKGTTGHPMIYYVYISLQTTTENNGTIVPLYNYPLCNFDGCIRDGTADEKKLFFFLPNRPLSLFLFFVLSLLCLSHTPLSPSSLSLIHLSLSPLPPSIFPSLTSSFLPSLPSSLPSSLPTNLSLSRSVCIVTTCCAHLGLGAAPRTSSAKLQTLKP
jgi:hypothetical protein